eukprot:g66932.t1
MLDNASVVRFYGNHETQSVVAWASTKEVLVGHLAANRANNVISNPWSLLGCLFSDLPAEQQSKMYCADKKTGPVMFQLRFADSTPNALLVSAEEACSHLLQYLKTAAEEFLGKAVSSAVVTVPSYFSPAQHSALNAAAARVNISIRILNEAVAAAMAHGLDDPASSKAKTTAILDLGGSGFDLRLLRVQRGLITIGAASRESRLSGHALDEALVAHLSTEFQSTHRLHRLSQRDDQKTEDTPHVKAKREPT